MRPTIKISFLLLCVYLSLSCGSKPLPSPCWEKIYGGKYIDVGIRILREDDGYLIGGSLGFEPVKIDEEPFHSSHAFILKTDRNGNVIWGKAYEMGIISAVTNMEKMENGYMVSGTWGNLERLMDIFMMKVSEDGKVIWAKGYGDGTENEVYGGLKRINGGYVLTGITNQMDGGGEIPPDVVIFKVNEDGDILWQWNYEGEKEDTGNYVFSIGNGKIMAIGEYEEDGLFLVVLDEDGNELWNKWYRFPPYRSHLKDVLQIKNKFVGTGYAHGDSKQENLIFFIQWDMEGKMEIVKGFKSEYGFYPQDILEDLDGYFVIGKMDEYIEMSPPNEYLFIMKLDKEMNIKWTRAIIRKDDEWEIYNGILTPEGIAIVGSVGNIWPSVSEEFSDISLLHISIDKIPYFGREIHLEESSDFGKEIKVESVSGKRVSSMSKIDLSPKVIEPDIKVKTFYLCGGEGDKTPPETKITSHPKSLTESTSATFEFFCNEASCRYQCKMDLGKWEDCTSPKTYTGLLEGEHTFSVRAIDSAGNVDDTPASYTWKIGPVPPRAILISYPERVTTSTTATFEFICDKPPCTFQCHLTGGEVEESFSEPEPCESPKTYTNLKGGWYMFEVWAFDLEGNNDYPAWYGWTIVDAPLLWLYKTGDAVIGSPSIGDIDKDGKPEIVIGSCDHKIYALNGEDGSVLWSYKTGDKILSSPAIADIDNDGKLEVVIGSNDDKIYALNGENGSILWSYKTGGDVTSSPAIGDIDKDGKPEIVIGSCDHKIYALNGEDGSVLWSYDTGNEGGSSPAIADIDNDGKLEVVIGCDNPYYNIRALNGENGSELWFYNLGGSSEKKETSSIADIDNDGKLEIIVSPWVHMRLYAVNGEDGSLVWSYSIETGAPHPSIADINNDGELEIVFGAGEDIYAVLTSSPVPPPNLLPWPKFKHDVKNTGLYTGDPYPPW